MTQPLEPDEARRLLDAAAAGSTHGDFDEVFRRARRSRRRWSTALAAMTVVVVAAAVAVPVAIISREAPTSSPALVSPTTGPVIRTNPAWLVGAWTVKARGNVLRGHLSIGSGLKLVRPCGSLGGEWAANHAGLFLGQFNIGSMRCVQGRGGFALPWLSKAVGYHRVGKRIRLTDSEGQTVALLTPIAAVQSAGGVAAGSLRPPAALPPGAVPATMADLVGRWVAAGTAPSNAKGYVAFSAHTTWSGSDGCNGDGGRYQVGFDGELLLLASGFSGGVACVSSPATSWVDVTRRVAVDGTDLVLYDIDGKVLGRLARQPTGTIIGTFVRSGGPSGTSDVGLSGEITLRETTSRPAVIVRTSSNGGHFTADVPPGTYELSGHSTQGNGVPCRATTPTVVTAGASVAATVVCNIR